MNKILIRTGFVFFSLPAFFAIIDLWAYIVIGHKISMIDWNEAKGFIALVFFSIGVFILSFETFDDKSNK